MIPAAYWLRSYKPQWFRSDLAAGVTLAAYVLPAALGDASLANLPPQAGLYACLFGGLAFWLLCSSRHTCISVTSAISLLIGSVPGIILGSNLSSRLPERVLRPILAAVLLMVGIRMLIH